MKRIYLTKKGYDEKMKELEFLSKTKRHEIAREIGKARELGDLSENAEYHAAKEQQGHIEKRIAELEIILSSALIIEDSDVKTDEVSIGSTVELEDQKTKERISYCLVSGEEADISQNKISVSSPVGQALMTRKVKEVVEIKVPAGTMKYRIISIKI